MKRLDNRGGFLSKLLLTFFALFVFSMFLLFFIPFTLGDPAAIDFLTRFPLINNGDVLEVDLCPANQFYKSEGGEWVCSPIPTRLVNTTINNTINTTINNTIFTQISGGGWTNTTTTTSTSLNVNISGTLFINTTTGNTTSNTDFCVVAGNCLTTSASDSDLSIVNKSIVANNVSVTFGLAGKYDDDNPDGFISSYKNLSDDDIAGFGYIKSYKNITEADPFWTGNESRLIIVEGYISNSTFYLTSNPNGFISSYKNISDGDIAGFGYIKSYANRTDADIRGVISTEDAYLKNDGDVASGNYNFDSDTLFVDSVNNRVGIGITNPDTKLVVGNTTSQNVLRINGVTHATLLDGAPVLSLFKSGSVEWALAPALGTTLILAANPANYTNVGLNAAARLTFGTNGDVTIVRGDLSLESLDTNRLLLPLKNAVSTPTLAFCGGGSCNTGFYENANGQVIFASEGTGMFKFASGEFTGKGINSSWMYNEPATATNPTFGPNKEDADTGIGGFGKNKLSIITKGVERMHFDADGNVGIGTTSPGAALHINSTGATNGLIVEGDTVGFRFRQYDGSFTPDNTLQIWTPNVGDSNLILFGSSSSSMNFIVYDGKVGIGTTSPAKLLELSSATDPRLRFKYAAFKSAPDWDGVDMGGLEWWTVDTSGGGPGLVGSINIESVGAANDPLGEMVFSTGRTSAFAERMRIDHNGKVGIGTPSPQQKLDVVGNVNVTGNITALNIFPPQYIFSHTNETIGITTANVWENITFSQEVAEIKTGITHNHLSPTSYIFTITTSGIYEIDFDLDVKDASPSASDIDVAARLIFGNGTEIEGSVFETDIIKQETEIELTHDFLAKLNAGDQIIFQYIADDADVEISTHGTFGDHLDSATVVIKKISNIIS